MLSYHNTKVLNWQSFGDCCLYHGGTYARKELQASLPTRNIAENKAKKSHHLHDGGNGGEDGGLQTEGKVQSGKQGDEVHRGEDYLLTRKQVLQVVDWTP